MKNISCKIGYWSAVSLTVFFITWIVCFVGIAVTSPMYLWNGLPHYLSYISTYNQSFAVVAKLAMLFFGPAYLLLVQSFYEYSSDSNKPLVRIGLLFALAFAITSSMHYFVQITSVKFCLQNGLTNGIDHFLQANPHSFLVSVNMLGWTFFLGLSSLFVALSFSNNLLNKWLRIFFYFLFISCFLAGFGYCFQIKWIIFLFVNVATGGGLLAISFFSVKYFKYLRE